MPENATPQHAMPEQEPTSKPAPEREAADMAARRRALNQEVIDEFRARRGTVAAFSDGAPLLLVHHVGAKSGTRYVSPLAYLAYLAAGENFVLVAANGGRDRNPAWYHNLVAHPEAVVEVGTRTVPVTARVAEGAERQALIERAHTEIPLFAQLQGRTRRRIPILVLEPGQAP